VFLYVEDRQEVMGCCWSLLELRFLQAEYIRIPEETFSLMPERDERDLSVHIARDCLEIKKLSQGTCQSALQLFKPAHDPHHRWRLFKEICLLERAWEGVLLNGEAWT
jgi:hypothetical protein